ncbi:hypothetical protein LTR93_002632 [Exophiala xenobiotica]|nr:hypothetical protein LTR93_002632 [Exophiala xenobiotica]
MSPLLLATLGLLSRCADSTADSSPGMFKAIHFRLLQLLITVGLVLCIVGGTSSTSSTGKYVPQTTTKAGVVLYLLALCAICVFTVVVTHKLSNAPSRDKWLAWAVILAIPFIFVRLIYSLISVFAHSSHFNLLTGSIAIRVCMAILEEMAVVLIYLAVGWKAEILTSSKQGPIASRAWKGNLGGGQAGQPGHGRRRRQGPIHALVGAGIAKVQERKQQGPQMSGP